MAKPKKLMYIYSVFTKCSTCGDTWHAQVEASSREEANTFVGICYKCDEVVDGEELPR